MTSRVACTHLKIISDFTDETQTKRSITWSAAPSFSNKYLMFFLVVGLLTMVPHRGDMNLRGQPDGQGSQTQGQEANQRVRQTLGWPARGSKKPASGSGGQPESLKGQL